MYVHTIFSLYSPSSRDILVASTFWLLWIMLIWTRVYKYIFKIMFFILLGISLELKLLNHMTVLILRFWETVILFSIVAVPCSTPTNNAQASQLSTSSSAVVIFCFLFVCSFNNSYLSGMKEYLMVLICTYFPND